MRLLLATLVLAAGVLVFVTSASALPIRSFDTGCPFSHSLPDDPILFPGQPGASHEHDFAGNTTTNAYSDGQSLLAANADQLHTNCKDSKDGAAYWFPALYELVNGVWVKIDPANIHAYYRSRPDPAVLPAEPFPVGFAAISDKHYWVCGGALSVRTQSAPTSCASGVMLGVVNFHPCWNGVDLHLAGETHVKDGGMNSCPVGYPVRIPALELLVKYNIGTGTHVFTLSSGDTSTYHADFLNAWDPDRLQFLIDECLNVPTAPPFCKDEELRP